MHNTPDIPLLPFAIIDTDFYHFGGPLPIHSVSTIPYGEILIGYYSLSREELTAQARSFISSIDTLDTGFISIWEHMAVTLSKSMPFPLAAFLINTVMRPNADARDYDFITAFQERFEDIHKMAKMMLNNLYLLGVAKEKASDVYDKFISAEPEKISKFMGEIKCTAILSETEDVEFAYTFPDVFSLLLFDYVKLKKSHSIIRKCENCGKLFMPSKRSDEIYCDNIYKAGKTCKQLGYDNKVAANEVLKTYRSIYKTQNARKQRNRKNMHNLDAKFSEWAKRAKKELGRCQNGEIDIEQMKQTISSDNWLYE